MDNKAAYPQQEGVNSSNKEVSGQPVKEVIQVIQEYPVISKEVVETGRVLIRKTVSQEDATVNLPILNESYHIERVPVNQTFDTPPPALRYEGDTMIIPVLREITVVRKQYEVIEELHISKTVTETPLVQEITLLKENVHIERTHNNENESGAKF